MYRKINLHNSLLDIQKKEIEIENEKADLRLKNLTFLKGVSDLMREGIIKNDSDIQIFINNELFFKKENKESFIGNENLIDVKEKLEIKDQDIPDAPQESELE